MPGEIENRRFNRIETKENHHYCKEWGYRHLGDQAHSGFFKCKLAHAEGYSVVVPDQIYLDADELSWIQPLSFTANLLAVVDDDIVCDIYMDISLGQTIRLRFLQSGFVRAFDDGSQLFRCTIYGPSDLSSFATGPAQRTDEGFKLSSFCLVAMSVDPDGTFREIKNSQTFAMPISRVSIEFVMRTT